MRRVFVCWVSGKNNILIELCVPLFIMSGCNAVDMPLKLLVVTDLVNAFG